MNKSERTRRHIIEKTAPLFNMNGFDGTSLSDLCRVTGLTKGALYGNFESKEELAVEGFKYAIGKMRAHGSRSMLSQVSYKMKLYSLLDFFLKAVLNPPVRGGCPLLNTAVEADDRRTSMKKTVVIEMMKSINSLAKLLERGKEAGEFRKNFDSKEMATVFFCSIEGAIMLSRVSGSNEAMKSVTKSIRSQIELISKQ
ncbi:MAG TPA: TetR/AcrR family transcriptional regulator [Cyclobacteriaceae bacterium]|nr:TetR/AcrR family transcriptional regulator [Cyclobacteriaceae bacterium]